MNQRLLMIRTLSMVGLGLGLLALGWLMLKTPGYAEPPSSPKGVAAPDSVMPKSSAGVPPVSVAGLLSATIENTKMIYSRREGVQIKLTLKAKAPVDVCLRENPLTQITVMVKRAGAPALKVQPVVDQLLMSDSVGQNRVQHLEPRQTWTSRFNLRQLQFYDGHSWEPGEYTVNGAFLLCEQGQPPSRFGIELGDETPIKFDKPVYFLIAH